MHLAERQPVLWVDPQISHLSPMRNPAAARALQGDRLRLVAPNIIRLTPVTIPGVTRPLLRDLATRQARRAVRRAVEEIGASVHTILVSSLNDMLDVVPSAQSVFYGTDDYAAGAPPDRNRCPLAAAMHAAPAAERGPRPGDLAGAYAQVVGVPAGHRDGSERL